MDKDSECPGGVNLLTGEPARCRPGKLKRWRGRWLCPNCWSREYRRSEPGRGRNRENARRFRRERPEDALDYQRAWRADKPGYAAEASRRSRARRRGATIGGDTRSPSE